MPAFSGLWDGVHGDGYAAMPKSDAKPPHVRGIVRTYMQRRAMHGIVSGLGQLAPAEITRINAQRQEVDVPGTFDYAAWKADKGNYTPSAGISRDVTITNAGSHVDPTDVTETIARPTDATVDELAKTFDTTLSNDHPADGALIGVTSPEWVGVVSDGT